THQEGRRAPMGRRLLKSAAGGILGQGRRNRFLLIQGPFEVAVVSGAGVERLLIMPASQLDGWRLAGEINRGQIQVRIRIIRLELDSFAKSRLGGAAESFAGQREA